MKKTGFKKMFILMTVLIMAIGLCSCSHTHIEVIDEVVSATCTASGLTEGKHCSECGEVLVAQTVVDALGHTEAIDSAVDPTCTASGLTEGKHCSECNEVLVAQTVVDALGHTEAIDSAVEPTCTANGLTEGKHCSECDEILIAQTVVDALGHTEAIDSAVDPTCTASGLTEGKHCSECDEILVAQTVVDALGHTEAIDSAVDPTCTASGLTEGKHCSECGEILVAQTVIDALGHTAAGAVTENKVDATCTSEGSYDSVVYCSGCGAELSREASKIAIKDHTAAGAVTENKVDATCTSEGSYDSVVYCSGCGAELSREALKIAIKDHTAAAAVTENKVDATCTSEGSYDSVVYCSVCEEEISRETVTVKMLEHDYSNGNCSVCGKEKPIYTREGNYIYFGEYPQTIKADDVTITSIMDERGYYLGSDGFYYAAVTAAPCQSGYKFSTDANVTSGVVYYFKVEPIRWRILSESDGCAFILCDSIITSAAYQSDFKNKYTTANGAPTGTYANNYEYSEIRKWLNDNFYNTAFSDLEKEIILITTVDNSAETLYGYDYSGEISGMYACESTDDKVFLLSISEASNSAYGFYAKDASNDEARQMLTSDYARATGVYMCSENYLYGAGCWWLRSPYYFNWYNARQVYYSGSITIEEIDYGMYGVVPAIRIVL